MSLVLSHHVNLNDSNLVKNLLSMQTIKEITSHIISKHSALIVDIETGRAEKILLKKEIISYLDQMNHIQHNREESIKSIMSYMFGYGILQPYIENDDVTDIDICRYDFIIIKKHGSKEILSLSFDNESAFITFCKLIVIRHGGVINEKDCHARVADRQNRLRINVTIGPRNVSGPSMTIRKHRQNPYDLDQLENIQMFDNYTKKILKTVMNTSSRIIIIGKGASGKTTLLRALLDEIPRTERFLVCESESELYTTHGNFIVQKVNKKEKMSSLDNLVRDGLTMSLDGYCVGELVGEEVYEFLKAGYTDHRIIGTLHAQGVESTVSRIQMMLRQTHKHLSDDYIAGAIDIIIYMRKFKISSITEVCNKGSIPFYNELVTMDVHRETVEKLEGTWRHLNTLKYRLRDELERGIYNYTKSITIDDDSVPVI